MPRHAQGQVLARQLWVNIKYFNLCCALQSEGPWAKVLGTNSTAHVRLTLDAEIFAFSQWNISRLAPKPANKFPSCFTHSYVHNPEGTWCSIFFSTSAFWLLCLTWIWGGIFHVWSHVNSGNTSVFCYVSNLGVAFKLGMLNEVSGSCVTLEKPPADAGPCSPLKVRLALTHSFPGCHERDPDP